MKKISFVLIAFLLFSSCANDEIKLDRTDTLGGIDINNNGVRDDIEDYINKNFTNKKEKKALFQFARAMQKKVMFTSNDREEARRLTIKSNKGLVCILHTFDEKTRKKQWQKIRSYTTNTKKRLESYLRLDGMLGGMVFSFPKGDGCED